MSAEIPVVVVRGGIAAVEAGRAVIVDLDNAAEDIESAEDALARLEGLGGVEHIRVFLRGIWPELTEEVEP